MKNRLTSLTGAPMTERVITIRNRAALGTEVAATLTAVAVILKGAKKLHLDSRGTVPSYLTAFSL